MATRRLGRPREFEKRAVLTVFLEDSELRELYAQAHAKGVSASSVARTILVARLRRRRRRRGG